MPGRILLRTTPDGSQAPVDAVKIDSAQNVTVSAGNLVIGTSGKGIDFSATPGTGTSELLSDYEEGTWTPVGNGITYSSASGRYTKIGRLVYLDFSITFPVTADVSSATMSGIPFSNGSGSLGGGGFRYTDIGQYLAMAAGITDITFFILNGNNITNATLSTKIIQGFVEYTV
jgi:hypothetical protein